MDELLAKDDDAWGVFGDDGDDDGDMPPMLDDGAAPPALTTPSLAQAWEIFDADDDDDEAPPPLTSDAGPTQTTTTTTTAAGAAAATGPLPSATPIAKTQRDEVDLRALLREFVEEHIQQTCSDFRDVHQPAVADDLKFLFDHQAFITDGKIKKIKSRDEDEIWLATARRVHDAAWDRLTRGGGWDHVCWREAFVFAQLYIALALVGDRPRSAQDAKLREAVKHLDMAIIMGGPAELVQAFLEQVEPAIVATSRASAAAPADEDVTHSIVRDLPQSKRVPVIQHPIARESTPTLTAFRKQYFDQRMPVVITGATAGWRALDKWRDLAYLEREYGHRTVPVEIGRPLDDDERAQAADKTWKESALTLSEFIRSYLLPSSQHDHHHQRRADGDGDDDHADAGLPFDRIGYLAQHALIEQLPALQDDFAPPQYCALGELSNINTWLGTSCTVTSLHFDSYDNFLTQVAGYKYVRLYHPSQTPFLYRDAATVATTTTDTPHEQGSEPSSASGDAMAISAQSAKAQGNFSVVVNIESPDLARYPLLREATYTETILGPGEMLFIPQNCWHYVRSLTTSFSLNFWF